MQSNRINIYGEKNPNYKQSLEYRTQTVNPQDRITTALLEPCTLCLESQCLIHLSNKLVDICITYNSTMIIKVNITYYRISNQQTNWMLMTQDKFSHKETHNGAIYSEYILYQFSRL